MGRNNVMISNNNWESLSYAEKNNELFRNQKQTLDLFLERNAISKTQYEKSLGDLIEKMGIEDVCEVSHSQEVK